MTTLHIIFLSGITERHANMVTDLLNRRTIPHGYEVSVVSVPGSDGPHLLGVVVLNDQSETKMDYERQPIREGVVLLDVAP